MANIQKTCPPTSTTTIPSSIQQSKTACSTTISNMTNARDTIPPHQSALVSKKDFLPMVISTQVNDLNLDAGSCTDASQQDIGHEISQSTSAVLSSGHGGGGGEIRHRNNQQKNSPVMLDVTGSAKSSVK